MAEEINLSQPELKNQISVTSLFDYCPVCADTGEIIGWDDCGREIVEPCGCNKNKIAVHLNREDL